MKSYSEDHKYLEFDGMGAMIGDQEILPWKEKAEIYADNPAKTESLLSKALHKAESSKQNQVLQNIWDKVHLLFSLVRDWSDGNYRRISKTAMITILAGLIYFVSPLDIVPDWIIGLGLVDDAAVLGLIINQLDKELVRYREWKNK